MSDKTRREERAVMRARIQSGETLSTADALHLLDEADSLEDWRCAYHEGWRKSDERRPAALESVSAFSRLGRRDGRSRSQGDAVVAAKEVKS